MTAPPIPLAEHQLLAPSRYRHPGDVIRLVAAGLLLASSLLAAAAWPESLVGPESAYVLGPTSHVVGRIVVGVVQVAAVGATLLVVAFCVRSRRFRLLGGLALAGGLGALATWGVLELLGAQHAAELTQVLDRGSWLAPTAYPDPPLTASAVAVVVVVSPWLSRSWRRAARLGLVVALAARLLAGTILPMELLLAIAIGLTVGAATLVTLGVPERRIGPEGIAGSLRRSGLQVTSVVPAPVASKGSRPFVAHTADGRTLFVKALGPDQRDADLLYRAYRAMRLRDVGDTPPAPSLFDAVEHQALVGVMAQRAGVQVPSVDRVVRVDDGSGLLVMEWLPGTSLDHLDPERITDELLVGLWGQVRTLHAARIAHRSLRPANVMITDDGCPHIVDFSFSELDATDRQRDLDIAELLASSAALVGVHRAVNPAAEALGAPALAPAIPLLQPLALSAATRRAVSAEKGLLTRIREATAATSGAPAEELARLQRVRPRTLVMIAAASAAFYVLLPQLAQVGSSWQALRTAQWAWLPLVVLFSVLTYVASAISLLGSVPTHPPVWPTVLAQGASSFVNRVSPSNVGGMALNVRFLQKTGLDATSGVAAVGVNSLAGGLVHAVLLVMFLAWAGRGISGAFQLPSSSKILVALALVAAAVGIVMATRRGRRFAAETLLPGIRSSWGNLRQVAKSPAKLTLLFGGSALVTLGYIGGLVASVEAFRAETRIAEIGAVYLVGSMIAAVAPTPGGLGAMEAALVAGLTGVGVAPGVAVPAVLTYRLATYWLPVLPGWYSLRALQRRDFV